jgi:CelD/BcsL family acetyltransferase involved in cellulose biosynthesis
MALITRGVGRGLGPLREQTRHLGTAGEPTGQSACVEHNHLLILPAHRVTFIEHLVTHLLRDKSWESLCLDGFPEAGLEEFQRELPGFTLRSREAPYYDLRATRAAGVDLLEPLGRSTRQNVRRLLRKYGELELLWAETRQQALEIFDELQQLHQARWQKAGQPGAFHSRRFRDFQRSLIEQSYATPESVRRVMLFRARQAGQTIGCLMLLVDRGRLLDYLSGFGDFDVFASPGVVTHVLCMTEALQRGYDAYDFLVGEKRHKDNLSTNVNRLVWANWNRPSLRSRTISFLGMVKRRCSELRLRSRPATAPEPAA